MVDFVKVAGADDSYENPRNFNEAWNHHDDQEKIMWRNSIK